VRRRSPSVCMRPRLRPHAARGPRRAERASHQGGGRRHRLSERGRGAHVPRATSPWRCSRPPRSRPASSKGGNRASSPRSPRRTRRYRWTTRRSRPHGRVSTRCVRSAPASSWP
jgi:hypothetical protein